MLKSLRPLFFFYLLSIQYVTAYDLDGLFTSTDMDDERSDMPKQAPSKSKRSTLSSFSLPKLLNKDMANVSLESQLNIELHNRTEPLDTPSVDQPKHKEALLANEEKLKYQKENEDEDLYKTLTPFTLSSTEIKDNFSNHIHYAEYSTSKRKTSIFHIQASGQSSVRIK
jgi:hypothetical protein